ncbi:hypothetical protein ABIC60_001254 [Phyllobacterium ifriqiyense]
MLGNPAKLSVFSHVPQTAFNLLYLCATYRNAKFPAEQKI